MATIAYFDISRVLIYDINFCDIMNLDLFKKTWLSKETLRLTKGPNYIAFNEFVILSSRIHLVSGHLRRINRYHND